MKSTARWCCPCAVLAALVLVAQTGGFAADMPEAPKASTFAPAADLAGQLELYVKELESGVKSEAEYKESATKVTKDANTVMLLALGLGLHDGENKYKEAAPAVVEAAKKVMAAKDFASAKAGVQAVQAAMSSKGDPSKLSWNDAKDASLTELMKQVPLINTKLKRYLRKFNSRTKETSGLTAAIAVIAQGSMPLADKTSKPNEAQAWYKHCAEMRDAAGGLNAAIHAPDAKSGEKAMKDLAKSCDDCHEVFQPQAKAKAAAE